MTQTVGQLQRMLRQDNLEVWSMDFKQMPLPKEERPALAEFLLSLMHHLSSTYGLTESVWLEATHIHVEAATQLLAPNARAWRPKTGFGIHPDGEAPRMWTDEDFSNAPFGTDPPVFNHQVFEVTAVEGHNSAITTMAGRGLLVLALLEGSVSEFKRQMHLCLSPLVRERAFHAYSFFFPLLSASSAQDSKINTWMGNAQFYLREDFACRTLLLFTKLPLESAFQMAGATRQTNDLWYVSLEA